MSGISRRRFMAAAAATVAAETATHRIVTASEDDVYRVIDQVPFGGQTRRLKLMRGDRYITALIFPTDYPTHFRLKPELFPVCTPRGIPVTGSHEYCFIHHQSISCGHGKVRVEGTNREVDFFRKLPFPDPQREDKWHRGFNLFQMGPSGIQRVEQVRWSVDDRIIVHLTLQWQTREEHQEVGETLLVEQRRYEVFQQEAFTVIDQYSRLAPADKPVTLVADRHSFATVRVHDLIDVEDGGTMRDSEGRMDLEGVYCDQQGERKTPRWVDCTGTIGENVVGMTLMGHADNLRNQFFLRKYGMMEVSAMLDADVRLTDEAPLVFAARFVAHDGPITDAVVDRLYQEFSGQRLR
ncbi:MAG: PmoA family protein [Planctomycetes bacterium]|nr:PmoA family protein [Planctomycetota bacterium]MBL7040950.1 PmoA family protein [Pirellulaceae bacterium]